MLAQATTLAPGIWIPFVAVLTPLVAWAIALSMMLSGMKNRQVECLKCHSEMLNMHRNADEFGFGTVALRSTQERDQNRLEQLIADNTRALREVSHYIRWSIENTTGKKPPPPMPADSA